MQRLWRYVSIALVSSPDLNVLLIFAAVAEAASFSKAGVRLGLPKSTVSRAISNLEETLGVRLVHRTTRSVSLSTAGQALYERTRPSLSLLEEALIDLPERDREPSGRLCITAPVDFGVSLLAEVSKKFLEKFPKVDLEFRLTADVLDLSREGIDVALRISSGKMKDSSLVAQKIGRMRFGIFASREYLAREGTPKTVADLGKHSWTLFKKFESIQLKCDGELQTVPVRGRLLSDDLLFTRSAVEQGLGLGFLPLFTVTGSELVRVLPKCSGPSGMIWAMTTSAKHAPRKVVAFLEVLRAVLSAHPEALFSHD